MTKRRISNRIVKFDCLLLLDKASLPWITYRMSHGPFIATRTRMTTTSVSLLIPTTEILGAALIGEECCVLSFVRDKEHDELSVKRLTLFVTPTYGRHWKANASVRIK